MLDHRDRVCVPIEVEMLPLYREPGAGRRRRDLRRRARRDKRENGRGMLARLRRQPQVPAEDAG